MDKKIRDGIYRAVEQEPLAQTLGMRLVDLGPGFSAVEMDHRPELMNNIFGRAHGGAIFSLIDEAFETVCQTSGIITVALNVSVSYLASPENGSRLRADAREINLSRKTATYNITVTSQDGTLIASAQALAYRTGKPLPFLETAAEG